MTLKYDHIKRRITLSCLKNKYIDKNGKSNAKIRHFLWFLIWGKHSINVLFWLRPFSSVWRRVSRGQFYQCSMRSFYVRKLRMQLFLCLGFRFVLYWHKTTGAKAACRTLMKLSPGHHVSRYKLIFWSRPLHNR